MVPSSLDCFAAAAETTSSRGMYRKRDSSPPTAAKPRDGKQTSSREEFNLKRNGGYIFLTTNGSLAVVSLVERGSRPGLNAALAWSAGALIIAHEDTKISSTVVKSGKNA